MADAIERIVDAGQSLMLRRVELVCAETVQSLRGERAMLVAIPFAIVGWLLVLCGTRSALGMHFPPFAVDIGLGLAHLVVAMGLLHSRGRSR